jgi:hypothetical protein
MGYWINAPGFTSGYLDVFLNFGGVPDRVNDSPFTLIVLLLIWGMLESLSDFKIGFAQVSNYITHCTLRDLRPEGSKKRSIPFGYGFDSVACPNYFFEVLGWFIAWLICGSVSAFFFMIVGYVQMWMWAKKKHSRYLKEFGASYRRFNRKVMIPGVM